MRVLVVEDEPALTRVLVKGLSAEQYAVDNVNDGETAIDYAEQIDYDVILLDVGLPKMDGITVLKRIRSKHLTMPVLMLTGRTSVEERVAALECGADDYLVKPFAFEELLARIHALLRRPKTVISSLKVADLEIDQRRHIAMRGGKPIPLTQREFALLEYLMRNAGYPVTRTMVLDHVWNLGFEGLTNIVDVYINYLRSKVDEGHEKKLIHTARGVGYMLAESQTTSLAA
jgi:DNA-binding response OmpR family regulator